MTQTNYLSPVWTHLTDIQPVKGEGVYLYDEAGTRFTDFTSGIGVVNTGHCHPKVVQAVQEQASQLMFGQINVVLSPKAIQLAEKLNAVTPQAIDRFFFSNSGAEAIEAAVKLARSATKRRNLIVFQGSFHGRTHQTMAMTTSKYVYRHNYQPLPGAVFVAPYPHSYFFGWNEAQTTEFCLRQLDLLLHSQTAPDETAALIIEPLLGEGGYVPAPVEFLQKLRALCDEYGVLLIVDEVQSGFGRTGKFFCYEYANIEPDIIVMAKGLGSGLPVSAIGASEGLMANWKPGTHGGTYGGGNAAVMAGAIATIDAIIEEGLVENAAEMGDYLQTGLQEMQAKYPVMGDVRGRGLMVGVEFTHKNGSPAKAVTTAVLQGCLQRNLLLLTCGSYQNVLRWIPPLVVNKQQIDEALFIFEEALVTAVS